VTEIFPLRGKRVLVAGHTGMAGSSIGRRLMREDCEILTISYPELDMTRQKDTEEWLAQAKPDGMPRKVMDVSRLAALGWIAKTDLEEGLKVAYDWYVANHNTSSAASK
jgi:nucleoside-diphosphate-sugar epimerase